MIYEDKYRINPKSDKSDWSINIPNSKERFTLVITDSEMFLVNKKHNGWTVSENFLKEHFILVNKKITNWENIL